MKHLIALVFALLLAVPAFAVQPDEILPDPALEARARELSKLLRCPVCQGENIDDSNADISKAKELLGYDPSWSFERGIKAAIEWYRENF